MVCGWYADATQMVCGCMRMVREWYADGTRMYTYDGEEMMARLIEQRFPKSVQINIKQHFGNKSHDIDQTIKVMDYGRSQTDFAALPNHHTCRGTIKFDRNMKHKTKSTNAIHESNSNTPYIVNMSFDDRQRLSRFEQYSNDFPH